MKNKIILLLLALMGIAGCENDEMEIPVDSQPEFMAIDQDISSLPGMDLTLTATIEDPAGIKSVNLNYEPWFLNKTIVKDSLPTSYNLNYTFKVPEDAQMGREHIIAVTTTNSGGKSTTTDIKVTLDLDVVKPTITVNNPTNGATILINSENEIDFDISVSDDEELNEFKIESDILNETIPISDNSYNYTNSLNIDSVGSYTFTISVKDATGNITSQVISINILDELKFDKMYITDVTTSEALTSDVFGIPALAEANIEEGGEGYVFTANYYSKAPNTEVRFIPQKGAFEPYTFGADPDVEGKLINGSSPEVNPIILPEIGYYEITMDLRDLTYTVVPYIPSDQTYDFIQLIATGVNVDGESTCTVNTDGSFRCFHFTSGKELTQNPDNPYRFSAVVELFDEPESEGNNGFIINANPAGWGPFWRFDDASDPDNAVPGGGENFVFTEGSYGTYNFVFDTHLNRVTITPVN